MHALLDRLKRERRWAVILFLAALAVIAGVQRLAGSQAVDAEPPHPAPGISG